jgi:hypothetical protein
MSKFFTAVKTPNSVLVKKPKEVKNAKKRGKK